MEEIVDAYRIEVKRYVEIHLGVHTYHRRILRWV